MESTSNVLHSASNAIKAQLAAYMPLSDTLVSLAFFLAFAMVLETTTSWMPKLTHWFIIRKTLQLVKFCKLLFFVVVFFITDSTSPERSTTQKVALAIFCLIIIYMICLITWYTIVAAIMLVRYQSLTMALSGSKVVIIDGAVFAVDCYSPILTFQKTVTNGTEEVRFGDSCLSSVPRNVAYRGILYAEDYIYHSTVKAGAATIIIFRTNKTAILP
ncbi:membrane protein [Bellinger River virus]|uniref:Membrane protein n=1 Tax=Bellinger River virus TaxID=2301728 RepID=A0A346I7J0_9NIDO|nr:membrane protein [Bellinger River virus]AXP11710.1 membrane protein [Bellinger River virus]